MKSSASKVVSFTPGFSPVLELNATAKNRFNGFRCFAQGNRFNGFSTTRMFFHRAEARCE